MYRKLCKYEFKSIGRTLLPIYLAVIAVSVINLISIRITNDAFFSFNFSLLENILGLFQVVAAFAYFGVLVALGVLTAVVIIQRFYKGLLCDEGYLMFTLPVKTWHLVASKATAALVMSIASTIAAMISIFILGFGVMDNVGEFLFALVDPRNWLALFQDLGTVSPIWPLYALELFVLGLAAALAFLFHIYVALALGHLAKKHRIMMSVAAYILISLAFSFLSGVGLIFVGNGLDYTFANLLSPAAAYQLLVGGLLAWNLFKLAVFFFGTERILSKKLNLE